MENNQTHKGRGTSNTKYKINQMQAAVSGQNLWQELQAACTKYGKTNHPLKLTKKAGQKVELSLEKYKSLHRKGN